MKDDWLQPAAQSVKHYLARTRELIVRLSEETDGESVLTLRLSSDGQDTAFHFAVAIGFAARALCPLYQMEAPNIPDKLGFRELLLFSDEITALIAPLGGPAPACTIEHIAGEAQLWQSAEDYVLKFALPNLVFHLTMAYAAMRASGIDLGKADFDGLHIYSNG